MKKKCIAALAAMVLATGFAACQEEVPPYLVIENIDDEDEDIHGKVVMGVTDPAEVPAHVKIPNGIVGIVGFENCTSLISITIPKSVAIIGFKAFDGCTSLESVTIPDSVTEIGHWAFSDCKSLKSVTIPNSVKKIDGGTFGGCRRGIEVTYKGNLKDWCSSNWDYALLGYAKSITLSDGTDLKKLTKIDAGDLKGVTSIGERAFSECRLLENVTIPEGVTKIGVGAFYVCTSLESVTIPNSVTEIGGAAFRGCGSLASVVIPRSVTEIGENAFLKCGPNLKVQYDGTKAQWGAISKYGTFSKNGDALPIIGTFVVQCTDGVVTEK